MRAVWTRATLAGVLVASMAACSARHEDRTVVYTVSGGDTAGTVAIQYANPDGLMSTDSISGTVSWTKELTLGEHAPTAHVDAHTLAPGLDTKLSLRCTITVDGKELARQGGSQACDATVELDDL